MLLGGQEIVRGGAELHGVVFFGEDGLVDLEKLRLQIPQKAEIVLD
jgi:hypothetical protein